MVNRKCPECGTEMKVIKEQFSIAWVCPKCGYGEATTTTEPIYDDDNIYSVILLENDSKDINIIKALSKFTGLNFLKTIDLINNPTIIYRGKAYELFEKKKELDNCNVNYRIEPQFPY